MWVPAIVSTQDSSTSLPRARALRTVWPSQTWLVRTQQPKKAVRRRFAIALHLPVLCANTGKLPARECPAEGITFPVARFTSPSNRRTQVHLWPERSAKWRYKQSLTRLVELLEGETLFPHE